MPRKAYTRPQKDAAIALARTMGAEAAADLLGMDPRTVTGWLAKAPARDDVEGWHAAQQLAQEQLLGQLATGRVKHPVTLATVSGIASRNVRYAALIRDREERRTAEQAKEPMSTSPIWWDAVNALDDRRASLVGAEFRAVLGERSAGEEEVAESTPDSDAAFLAFIESVAAMSDDDVRDRLLELEPDWAPRYGWNTALARLTAAIDSLDGPPAEGPRPLTGPVYDAPTDKEGWMVNVTPDRVAPPVQQPPRGPLTVLEAGEHLEEHPTWRRLE